MLQIRDGTKELKGKRYSPRSKRKKLISLPFPMTCLHADKTVDYLVHSISGKPYSELSSIFRHVVRFQLSNSWTTSNTCTDNMSINEYQKDLVLSNTPNTTVLHAGGICREWTTENVRAHYLYNVSHLCQRQNTGPDRSSVRSRRAFLMCLCS